VTEVVGGLEKQKLWGRKKSIFDVLSIVFIVKTCMLLIRVIYRSTYLTLMNGVNIFLLRTIIS